MKILVVDDNPYVLSLMQKSLEAHGEVEARSEERRVGKECRL